jgi:hypothetical protein
MMILVIQPRAIGIVNIMSSTDPRDVDDGWADLARELGLEPGGDSPRSSAYPPESVTHASSVSDDIESHDSTGWVELEEASDESSQTAADVVALDDVETEDSGESEDAEEGDEIVAENSDEESAEPGTKKRRRRRRRRKKKSVDDTAAGIDGTAAEAVLLSADEGPESSASYDGSTFDPEESGPEMTRELIRNWNVPSWEEIVAGLYRPPDR